MAWNIYGWGPHYRENIDSNLGPIQINFEIAIKYIYCYGYNTFVVDINGNAFYWGNNLSEIQWKPNKMSR